MDKIAFVKKHYADQIQALNWLIEERFGKLPASKNALLRFGGGTALAMYHFQHRLSFDIDLFATDAQVLGYFSPKMWLEESRYFKSEDYIEQADHIGILSHNNIKVDILVSSNFSSNPHIDSSRNFFQADVFIEDIEDIIAKKIVFRNDQNKTRDIIDIAVSLTSNKALLSDLLISGAVHLEHLLKLNESLKHLDKDRFQMELEIVEPFEEYREVSVNAPNIVLSEIDSIILRQRERVFDIAASALGGSTLEESLFKVNNLIADPSGTKPKP